MSAEKKVLSHYCGEKIGRPGWETIRDRYNEPHRHYHNLEHIAACLSVFEEVKSLAADYVSLRDWWVFTDAVILHDLVYDPTRQDNEDVSAALVPTILDSRWIPEPARYHSDVAHLIQMTKHTTAPVSVLEKLVIDIDLSIFGESELVFDAYERDVRKEYAWVEEEPFLRARRKVLQKFGEREWFFYTDVMRRTREGQAQANLWRSLDQIDAKLKAILRRSRTW